MYKYFYTILYSIDYQLINKYLNAPRLTSIPYPLDPGPLSTTLVTLLFDKFSGQSQYFRMYPKPILQLICMMSSLNPELVP